MALTDPVPSQAIGVFKRNMEDSDSWMNQTSGTVTNRTGKTMRPLPVISDDIEQQLTDLTADVQDIDTFNTSNSDTFIDNVGTEKKTIKGIENDARIRVSQVLTDLGINGIKVLIQLSTDPLPNPLEYGEGQPLKFSDTLDEFTLINGAWVENGNVGDEVDVTAASHLTLAQAQASDLRVGQYVRLTDRGGLWKVTSDTPNTFDILDLGDGLSLTYQVENQVVHLSHLGFSTTASPLDNRLAFDRAKTLSKFITGGGGTYSVEYLSIDTDMYLTFAGRTFTTLNITSFTSYKGLKCCVLNKGLDSLGLASLTNIEGVEIVCQTGEPNTQGMLVTRKTNMTDVYIRGAVLDGMYFRAFDANTESPYFCNLTNVWSKLNGRDGIKFTDNCNANLLVNCQADRNQGHGIIQTQVAHGDTPIAVYNNTIINGQASYNQLHGLYVERGSEFIVSGTYTEFNSQIDGGNPKVGAYKNLAINNLAARCKCFLGSVGTSEDVHLVVGAGTNLSNEVYVGGVRVTPHDSIELGYQNAGVGKQITLNGSAGCVHRINFAEGADIPAWLEYNGVPASPFNEVMFKVNSGSTPISYRTNGQLAFFGGTPVSRPTVTSEATDAATTQALVNSLRAALISLGLVV